MGGEAFQGTCAEVMSRSRCVPNCVCSSGLHCSRTNNMSIQNTFHPTDFAVEKYPFIALQLESQCHVTQACEWEGGES